MSVLRISRSPAVTVSSATSVREALELMSAESVGAVVVVQDDEAVGVFTRRDALERVVLKGQGVETTLVSDVMTSPVEVLEVKTNLADALQVMATRPFNHLPVVDENRKVVGLVTTKRVMKRTIERLSNELDSLEAFISADGIGG